MVVKRKKLFAVSKKNKKVIKKVEISEKIKKDKLFGINYSLHQSKEKKEKKERNSNIKNEAEFAEKIKQVEDGKNFAIFAGVSFCMVIILIFWIVNLKSIFKVVENKQNKNDFNFNNVNDEFNIMAEQMKNEFGEFKKQKESFIDVNELNQEEESDVLENESILGKDEIIELKNRLEGFK